MALFQSKLFLSIIAVVIILVLLVVFGRKSVHAELVIPASPEEIWKVLMDVDGYKEWNPILIPVAGEFKSGAKMTYEMIGPDNKKNIVDSKVIELIEQMKLNQL